MLLEKSKTLIHAKIHCIEVWNSRNNKTLQHFFLLTEPKALKHQIQQLIKKQEKNKNPFEGTTLITSTPPQISPKHTNIQHWPFQEFIKEHHKQKLRILTFGPLVLQINIWTTPTC